MVKLTGGGTLYIGQNYSATLKPLWRRLSTPIHCWFIVNWYVKLLGSLRWWSMWGGGTPTRGDGTAFRQNLTTARQIDNNRPLYYSLPWPWPTLFNHTVQNNNKNNINSLLARAESPVCKSLSAVVLLELINKFSSVPFLRPIDYPCWDRPSLNCSNTRARSSAVAVIDSRSHCVRRTVVWNYRDQHKKLLVYSCKVKSAFRPEVCCCCLSAF